MPHHHFLIYETTLIFKQL